MSDAMVKKAQEIVEHLTDIRPEYRGRRVLSVERVREPNTVIIHFDAGPKMRLIGTFAKQILAAADTD